MAWWPYQDTVGTWIAEGPIRRPERGGVNGSRYKFFSKDRTRNSQPRILTRVCQGSIVTVDLPTLGATPNDSEAKAKIKERKA
jgi:hypothetical protein